MMAPSEKSPSHAGSLAVPFPMENSTGCTETSTESSSLSLSLDSPSNTIASYDSIPNCFGSIESHPSDDKLLYRNQCVSMVSIAQGGLKRIRRDARTAHVTLMDVVEMFGRALTEIALYNDSELARKGWECDSPVKMFDSRNRLSVPSYLWNIVLSLNRHADPSFFATDGSALSESESKSSLGSGHKDKANLSSSESETLERSQDDSAMGRGLRCLLLALVYIDRIVVKHPKRFRVTSKSIYRIMLTAIYVAAKFTDDSLPRPHAFFSKIGGVSHRKLKKLENAFCQLIEFDFYVTDSEFQVLCMEQLRWAVRGARTMNAKKKQAKKERKRRSDVSKLIT